MVWLVVRISPSHLAYSRYSDDEFDDESDMTSVHEPDREAAQQAEAALLMQKVQRGKAARARVARLRREKQEQDEAALLMQKVQRGKAARARVARLRRERQEQGPASTAAEASSAVPGEHAEPPTSPAPTSAGDSNHEGHAAVVLQKLQRGKAARARVAQLRREKQEQAEAAVLLQKVHRGKAGRSRVAQLRRTHQATNEAAVAVQAQFRGWNTRRQLKHGTTGSPSPYTSVSGRSSGMSGTRTSGDSEYSDDDDFADEVAGVTDANPAGRHEESSSGESASLPSPPAGDDEPAPSPSVAPIRPSAPSPRAVGARGAVDFGARRVVTPTARRARPTRPSDGAPNATRPSAAPLVAHHSRHSTEGATPAFYSATRLDNDAGGLSSGDDSSDGYGEDSFDSTGSRDPSPSPPPPSRQQASDSDSGSDDYSDSFDN